MKKIIGSLLAAAMLVTSSVQPILAEEVDYGVSTQAANGITISSTDIKTEYYTLTANYTISGATSYAYQWVTRASSSDEYTEYPTDTSQTYIVTPRDKNMYLNCYVTGLDENGNEMGERVLAGSDYQITKLGHYGRTTVNLTNESTPKQYKFSVASDTSKKEYILLDEFNDENSAFYIFADHRYGGTKVFDTVSTGYKFDPNSSTNIGYVLNNSVRTDLAINGEAIDKNIVDHINWNHNWWTEGSSQIESLDKTAAGTDYSFTAGISLISMSETAKYRNKFGWNLNANKTWWWSRTQRSSDNGGGNPLNNILVMKSGAQLWNLDISNPAEQTPSIRPTFYLDDDFFGEVKCRVFDETTGEVVLGSEVCKTIAKRYTYDELSSIYEVDELEVILSYAENCPTLTNVKIAGTASTGSAVTADYTFLPYKNGAESGTTIIWMYADAANSSYTRTGDTGKILNISDNLKGKYIKFVVVPSDENGRTGKLYVSDPVKVIDGAGTVTVSNVVVTDTSVTPTIKNATDKSVTARLLTAVYDENNMLVSATEENVTISSGQSVNNKTILFPTITQNQRSAVMVWVNGYQPLLTMSK